MDRKIFIPVILVLLVLAPNAGAQTPEPADCAKEGEHFSPVYEEYPERCCEGLTEWYTGMETRVSIADVCYVTGLEAGNPLGICINCGNGICEDIEGACGCPEDCLGKGRSRYSTIQDFCNSDQWRRYAPQGCRDPEFVEHMNLKICKLCPMPIDPIMSVSIVVIAFVVIAFVYLKSRK